MPETFSENPNQAKRAQQVWQILVGKAMNRQTETYLRLSNLMYSHDAAGVLGPVLGHIAYYCEDEDLPQLNVLVVGTDRGTPGYEIPLDPNDFDSEREAVYNTNWYDIVPPSAADLAAAMQRRKEKA